MSAQLLEQISAIEQALHRLRHHHRVPGAALAIRQGDAVVELASGVTSVNTGVDVTPETLFQIGSNTKVYTTTLMMQLVEEGRVHLDTPVREYLPDFRLKDPEAAGLVTVRQLLNHTSGIEGDHFAPFGPGDDSIQRYVASLADIGQIHAPGERFSYCNAAFVVAGRILEVVTGKPFHAVFDERIRKPLNLRSTSVLIEEMIGFRYAVGHYLDDSGTPRAVDQIMMDRSAAPAGSITSATAADVVRFVQMHLDGGRAPDGARVLSEHSVALMQTPTVTRPASPGGHGAQGLGWRIDEWDGHRVIGHGGGTNGQLSFLDVLPDDGLTVVLLTNSGSGGLLWRDLGTYIFDALAGVHMPGPERPTTTRSDIALTKYEGTFERLSQRVEIRAADGVLHATMVPTGPLAEAFDQDSDVWRLVPLDQERFYFSLQGGDEGVVTFSDFDDEGRPTTLFSGRLARRVTA
jgi:CubicO group peptidase (beta-lactamase class C family)